jgi:hypothetical protein
MIKLKKRDITLGIKIFNSHLMSITAYLVTLILLTRSSKSEASNSLRISSHNNCNTNRISFLNKAMQCNIYRITADWI